MINRLLNTFNNYVKIVGVTDMKENLEFYFLTEKMEVF